jgi:hypothetical protein
VSRVEQERPRQGCLNRRERWEEVGEGRLGLNEWASEETEASIKKQIEGRFYRLGLDN